MSQLLQAKISSVRRKLALVKALRGIAAATAAIVLILAAGMLMDLEWELPRWVRAALLAINITVTTYLLLTHILAPLIWGPDDDEIALLVERATPQFSTRLIASVQLARPGAVPANSSASLARAMIVETERLAEPMDFAAVVRPDEAMKMTAIAGFVLLLGLGSFIYGNSGGESVASDLLARAFLSDRPVPRKTRVEPVTQNLIVALGDPVTLESRSRGRVPSAAMLDVRYESGRSETFNLIEPDDLPLAERIDGLARRQSAVAKEIKNTAAAGAAATQKEISDEIARMLAEGGRSVQKVSDELKPALDSARLAEGSLAAGDRHAAAGQATQAMQRLAGAVGLVSASRERFRLSFTNVSGSFQYRFRLGDGRGPWFRVIASPRPTVAGVDFTLRYPPYTRLAPAHKSPGDLSLLAGSELAIKVSSNKPVREGAAAGGGPGSVVRLVGVDQELPLKWTSAARTELTAILPKVPTTKLTGLSFHLVDEYGIGSANETVYPVELVLDKDPTIKVLFPDRKEELALSQAKLKVAFEATDDFGVARIILWHRLDVENSVARPIELDLAGLSQEQLRRVERIYLFDLLPLHLPEGAAVEYWLEVQDGNNATGPGKVTSEHYRVRIVSELEKRAELMNRLNDQLGTVEYVTQDQEKLNQRLSEMIQIREKTPRP